MIAGRMSVTRTTVIGAILVALGPISLSLYTPAMPELVKAFDSTDSMIKLTLSLYFGGFAVAQLISGTLSDAWGRRKVTILFMLIYLIGSLMSAFAPTAEVLLIGRLVQGAGASAGMTVSRAIIRDQFTGNQAAGIMNLMGMLLAVGPAFAPTVGGYMLPIFGWQSIFLLMVVFAAIACITAAFFMEETVVPDAQKAKIGPIIKAYGEILGDLRFVAATIVIGGAVGVLYTQATILPFILINIVELTPGEFGTGMLIQSGSYFLGSIIFRQMLKRWPAKQAMLPGLALLAIGSVATFITTHFLPLSFFSVMIPAGIFAFAIAFTNPYMMTVAIAPFPHIAGTASALMGFVQMGTGLVGGIICAIMGAPVLALGTVIPIMGVLAIASYFVYRAAAKANPLPEGIAESKHDEAIKQAAE